MDKYQSISEYPFVLFVGGIPSRTPIDTVREYFSNYGCSTVESFKNMNGKPKRTKSSFLWKGCCLLGFESREHMQRVLSLQPMMFEGRNLRISEYKSGTELKQHVSNINNRRAIVKKVPKDCTEEQLSLIISNTISPIEGIYKYLAKDPSTQHKRESKQQWQTFSVLFTSEEALQCIDSGLSLPYSSTHSILIEPFHPLFYNQRKYNHRNNRIKVSAVVSPPSSPNIKIKHVRQDICDQPPLKHSQGMAPLTFLGSIDDDSGIEEVFDRNYYESPKFSLHGAREKHHDHSVKPTSIQYHFLSGNLSHHSSSPLSSTDNIQFRRNMSKAPSSPSSTLHTQLAQH